MYRTKVVATPYTSHSHPLYYPGGTKMAATKILDCRAVGKNKKKKVSGWRAVPRWSATINSRVRSFYVFIWPTGILRSYTYIRLYTHCLVSHLFHLIIHLLSHSPFLSSFISVVVFFFFFFFAFILFYNVSFLFHCKCDSIS